ncbi:MAG: LysM peptidoglycan-binding domain-containing protein [Bacteroidota bacterium]|nr:LysM peptidoglycan-binding domain-containing protein [Bacteroidota bacterium]
MGLEREKEKQIRNLETEIKSLEKEIARKRTRAEQGLDTFVDDTNNDPEAEVQDNSKITETERDIPRYHTVKAGESMFEIAGIYGVSVGEIISLNNLSSNQVYTGQVLLLENSGPTMNEYHRVEPGETLFSIAKLYGVSISDLRRMNSLSSNEIRNGQRLIISTSGQSRSSGIIPKKFPVIIILRTDRCKSREEMKLIRPATEYSGYPG